MGLNGSWPHRRAFACWQRLPASEGSEVTDFSGKVHFSGTLKQVESRRALFTQTAQAKMVNIKPTYTFVVDNCSDNLFFVCFLLFWSCICSVIPDTDNKCFRDSLTSSRHHPVNSEFLMSFKLSTRNSFI